MIKTAIGIDLGTTNSSVSIWQKDKAVIIPNELGNKTTPSFVAFTESGILIGDSAKSQAQRNPRNTVFNIMRLIGRNFSDPEVQSDMKLWPFRVECGPSDKPYIVIEFKGIIKKFKAEEIAAMILIKMKEIAEAYIHRTFKDVVITVHDYFNNSQREAIINAGAVAGLNVIRIVRGSSAAAIAYGISNKMEKGEKNILIFDVGGGAISISVLAIEENVFEVKSTYCNTHFGGEDFDNRIIDFCKTEFLKKTGIDISDNPRAFRRLRTQCERAKHSLSSNTQAQIEVDVLDGKNDFSYNMSRAKFEELNMDLFKKCIWIIDFALHDALLSKEEIYQVILIGGSTQIPKIIEMVRNYFGKELIRPANADEAAVYGASIEAAILTDKGKNLNPMLQDVTLLDIASISLGIEIAGGAMLTLIPKNSTIPIRKTQIFSTYFDNQPSVIIQIYEGERSVASDNNLLVKFEVNGIPPAPKGIPQIEITFDIDANSVIKVVAVEKSSKKSFNITITKDNSKLSFSEIRKLLLEGETYKNGAEKVSKFIEFKKSLELFCNNWNCLLNDEYIKSKISKPDRIAIAELTTSVIKWLESRFDIRISEYQAKIKEIAGKIDPIIERSNLKPGNCEPLIVPFSESDTKETSNIKI